MIVGFDATTLRGRMSGVGYYTARLMESLANGAGEAALARLVVLSNRRVPVPESARLEVYSRHRLGLRSLWMQLMLPRILAELKPDLVHYTNYLAPLRARVPYVVSFHDMTLSLFPGLHTLKKRLLTSSLLPLVARRARLILTPSGSTRNDVIRLLGIDPERVRVIPYAAAPLFRPAAQGPELLEARYGLRPPYLLYVGTLEPRKNLARALRAFARVAAAHPEQKFALVGERGWKYQDVLHEARRSELKGRVLFLGYVPEEHLPLLYTHASALVYPSLYEGFGLPVIEAMACGTPVLTSRCSSLGELAGGSALLVDPLDEAGLAAGLRALCADPALCRALARRGLERAAAYSWERTGRETVAAYRDVYEETRARAH